MLEKGLGEYSNQLIQHTLCIRVLHSFSLSHTIEIAQTSGQLHQSQRKGIC